MRLIFTRAQLLRCSDENTEDIFSALRSTALCHFLTSSATEELLRTYVLTYNVAQVTLALSSEVFNALFLKNLAEYRHESYVAENCILGLHFCRRRSGSASII